jgi:signal transduction histidine kinase
MPDSPRLPLVLRLGPRSRAVLDLAAATVYAVLACAVLADQVSGPPPLLGAVLVAGPLAAHRRAPLPAYAVLLLAMALAPTSAALAFVALPPLALVLGQLAAQRSTRVAVPLLLLGLAATSLPDLRHNGAAVPFGLVLVATWAVGMAAGQQQRYAGALVAHREALAVQQAREASAAERLRLARDLHDVVAHSMSAVTVQAAYGNLVFTERPDEARAALGAVETTGRQALAEMRDLLGVLREPGRELSPLGPAATVRDLDRLVAETARAGVRVDVATTGEVLPLPPGLDGTAFRIVQEALTNVVRHARTGAARVALGYGQRELSVVVTDDGCGPRAGTVPGHGLVGIRERVALHGGNLAAGPGPDGGFQVDARLPLPDPGA